MQKRWDLACHASAQDNVEVMKWLLKNMPSHADISHSTEVCMTRWLILLIATVESLEPVKFLMHRTVGGSAPNYNVRSR